MTNETRKIKILVTLLEDMLGTASNDKEIYRNFIASKAPDAKSVEDEIASVGVEEYSEKTMTVFHRDANGNPIIYDYLFKVFFKNACSIMKTIPGTKASKIKAFKKLIDGAIFPFPRQIQINMIGELGLCQRPLRASTALGERVALACSESVPAGSVMCLEIECLNNDAYELAIELLDYGRYNGLGQWHNGGKGRFDWKDVTDKSEEEIKDMIDRILGK